MKDPKEMTDDELYQYLWARKIRLQVTQEISTTYTPQSIVVSSLYNPVHGATKATIVKSSSVACDYTKVRIEDIVKEMDSRGLDSKKYDNDDETSALAQKWIRAWKSTKVLGTIAGLDLTEIYDVIELCNDMGDIITDFGELSGDISEMASDIGNMITESANGVNIGEILQNANEIINGGNEILVDTIDVAEDTQDIINDINGSEKNEIIETKGDTVSDDNTTKDSSDNSALTIKDTSTTYEPISNAAVAINLQEIANQIVQMTNLKKISASFSYNNENNLSIPVATEAPIDTSMDSTVTKVAA